VTDGPFRIETLEPGERVVLAANPAWRGPDGRPPGLDRLVLRVLPEPSTRMLAYEAGEVDVVDGLSVRDADRLARAVPGTRVVSKGLRLGEHLVWNTRDSRFADVATRVALAHALDVDAFLARAFADAEGVVHARRAVGTITPELADVVPDLDPVPYDPAMARTLLAAAGWSDPDGDGVLDRDGQRLAFDLLYAAANPRRHEAAQWIRARLAEVGAAVTLAPRDSTAVFDAMRRRTHAAAIAGWASALAVDPSPLWRADTPERPNPSNVSGWGDGALDAALDAALRARDPDDATARWREVQRTIFAAQPFTFLWWHDDRLVLRDRVTGARPGVLGVLDDVGAWSVAP
jgi:peptide/nickel transport system substrate-binding protein